MEIIKKILFLESKDFRIPLNQSQRNMKVKWNKSNQAILFASLLLSGLKESEKEST